MSSIDMKFHLLVVKGNYHRSFFFFFVLFFTVNAVLISNIHAQSQMPTSDMRSVMSTIALPLDIDISDIAGMLNKSVTGIIYEDDSYTDNEQDEFKIKVWKKGDIKIATHASNQLKIAVPLKVWAEKGIGAFGYVNYQQTEFELILNFKTVFSMRPDWTIKTVTTPDGYTWITKPVLKYKYVDVPITPIVANILDKEHTNVSKTIDQQVAKSLDLKPYALDTWNTMSTPMHLSEEYDTWLVFTPKHVKMTPLTAQGNSIRSTLGIDVITSTLVGKKPATPAPIKTVPALTFIKNLDRDFTIHTPVVVDYDYASVIANQQFKNYKMEFLNGKKTVTVENIDVSGGDDGITLHTLVSGSIKGTIEISGIPYVDSVNKRISLRDVNFRLSTKNIFLKSASWLFNGTFERMIEKDYGIPLEDIRSMAYTSLSESINRTLYPGIQMKGTVTALKPTDVRVDTQGMVINILTKGAIQVLVKGMSSS